MNITLEESYRYCQRIARDAASNFYWAFWLLPREKRRAMCALYSFSRHSDDLGDSHEPVEQREAALRQWRSSLAGALEGHFDQPLLPALADTVARYGIPRHCLFDVVDGVAMDLYPRRFETFDELSEYCYKVASSVGLACVHIWGFSSRAICEPSVKCGYAFQLTNILRDLKEDAARGRIYLPLEDLRRFDYDVDELLAGVCDERFVGLVEFEVGRAERLYEQAEKVADYLLPEGRRVFSMMLTTYRSLLAEIHRRREGLLTARIRLGWRRKMAIAGTHFLAPRR